MHTFPSFGPLNQDIKKWLDPAFPHNDRLVKSAWPFLN